VLGPSGAGPSRCVVSVMGVPGWLGWRIIAACALYPIAGNTGRTAATLNTCRLRPPPRHRSADFDFSLGCMQAADFAHPPRETDAARGRGAPVRHGPLRHGPVELRPGGELQGPRSG